MGNAQAFRALSAMRDLDTYAVHLCMCPTVPFATALFHLRTPLLRNHQQLLLDAVAAELSCFCATGNDTKPGLLLLNACSTTGKTSLKELPANATDASGLRTCTFKPAPVLRNYTIITARLGL
jgi:hypothetical protein